MRPLLSVIPSTMNRAAKQRLAREIAAAEYRARLFRRIFFFLCFVAAACFIGLAFTSCAHTEMRPAIILLAESDVRDSHGRYHPPVHRVTGEPATTMQTIYRTTTGAEMDGPIYTFRAKP